MTRPQPSFVTLWLACDCGHWWDDWQPLMVTVDTWIAHLRSLHCPACGKTSADRTMLMRTEPLSAKPPAP